MIEPSIGVNPVMPGFPGFVSAYPCGLLSRVTAPSLEVLTTTEVKRQCRVDDAAGEPAPTAITVALAGAGAGNVDNGAHRYLATFVTADGETDAGTISSAVTVADKTANGKVALSAIPIGGSTVTGRNLYRTTAGGTVYLFLASIANNTATSYTDNIADSALGAGAPTANTTADPELGAMNVAAREWAEQETERALLTQTWALYLDSFPWWRAPIFVPKPPLQTVDSIKYYDQDNVLQTWDPSNYIVLAPGGLAPQRGQIVPASGVSWPLLPSGALTQRRPDAVQVQFTCGWTSRALVPFGIKAAMKLMVGNLWMNREAAQIVRGSSDVLPLGVDALLAPYRVSVY